MLEIAPIRECKDRISGEITMHNLDPKTMIEISSSEVTCRIGKETLSTQTIGCMGRIEEVVIIRLSRTTKMTLREIISQIKLAMRTFKHLQDSTQVRKECRIDSKIFIQQAKVRMIMSCKDKAMIK